jgi:hypothetical protein
MPVDVIAHRDGGGGWRVAFNIGCVYVCKLMEALKEVNEPSESLRVLSVLG